ncbi:MAG: methylated-DNA--[protein]-cysteine S-methyltransferase [Bacteroidales bacterium]|nr:methylated-DNA--[protein]-cysteine S-methyltransferase [Bacteroidales bacterium]
MAEIQIQYLKTSVGELILGSFDEKLCLCDWRYRKKRDKIDKRICQGLQSEYVEKESPIHLLAKQQINEYLIGERKEFDIPLLLIGSDFQKLVWNELLKIPFGKTETYLGLARKMKNESAIRAVATANGANAISIIVPCHRIIGSDKKLVGYAGGTRTKRKLLELEAEATPDPWKLF